MNILRNDKDKDKAKLRKNEHQQNKKLNFEYKELVELVVFLACIGSHIAGSASHYFMYHYFSKKSNFPFEFKNSRQTCSRHLNASFHQIHNKVKNLF